VHFIYAYNVCYLYLDGYTTTLINDFTLLSTAATYQVLPTSEEYLVLRLHLILPTITIE